MKPGRFKPKPTGEGLLPRGGEGGPSAKPLTDGAALPNPAPPLRGALDSADILSDLRRELSEDTDLRRRLDMRTMLQRQARRGAGRPRTAAVLMSQAAALRQAGKLAESIGPLRQAIAADPDNPSAHYDLGLTLAKCQRHLEAAGHLRRAATLKPNYADAHYALGVALQNLGRDAMAMDAFRRAIELAPRLADAHNRLGHLLRAAERFPEAQECFRRAAAAARNTTFGRISEATFLIGEGEFVKAAEVLRRALAREPDNFMANVTLAHVLSFTGELDAAIAQYRRALALGDDPVIPWSGLVQLKKMADADRPLIAQILDYLRQDDVGTVYRMLLEFTLGKAFDDLWEYDEAIKHYEAANCIRHGLASFERDLIVREVDRTIACGTAQFFVEREGLGSEDETPVFVVGMVRSGTTLVEQVLSSHPEIAGAGELPFWRGQSVALGESGPAAIDEAAARRIAGEYLAVLRRCSATALRVTDKMPFNYMWIGLIRAVFPHARFIHCRRHPIDTCLSIYFTPFSTIPGFASDRDDLVFYYREYLRLMEHWRAVLPPDRFLEVDYEAMTADPEPQARRLVDFCGLSWDPACLRPDQNKRVVQTASIWQARQPIYRSSVERWRRYEPWLGSLRALSPTES